MDKTGISFLFKKNNKQTTRRLVVANGVDLHTLEAVGRAKNENIVTVTITGDKEQIISNFKKIGITTDSCKIEHCTTAEEAVARAVDLARNGKADLIMKGLIGTDVFMKAILNKERGLLTKGAMLSHVAMLFNDVYHKPIFISDVAILPLPDLLQKQQMVKYLVSVAQKAGIKRPKVAFIAATEKVIEKMPACTDAAALKKLWEDGAFPGAVCDGPMALDLAVDKRSAEVKGFNSPVAGDADCLLFPNIESGNVFYKVNTMFCNARAAAIVMGTMIPAILSSRGDSTDTKYYSIALASLIG
ncbi:MAG: phosphate acyltransferase [Prolixibacteraceae bacterium]|jgi:phosphotransacetylase|nr:phosphate acyltransferase [Prolixibacteraceae bacterium]